MTFHLNTKSDLNKVIDKCHMYGIKVGLALNPEDDVELLNCIPADINTTVLNYICFKDLESIMKNIKFISDMNETKLGSMWSKNTLNFTENEQRTVMNLWCMFRSPLMMGGELTLLDGFTLSLLTNRDLLEIDRHSSGNRPLVSDREKAVWTCTDGEGREVYAFFNLRHAPQEINFDLGDTPAVLEDLWTKEKAPLSASPFTLRLEARESRVFRILHK